MIKIIDLIQFFWNGNILNDPYPNNQVAKEAKSLPNRVKQSLAEILDKIKKETDPRKVDAFRLAYEKILTYFWRRGYDKHEISDYFHDLPSSIADYPNTQRKYVA